MWDLAVLNAAVVCLGPSLWNEEGKLHRALDSNISHAMSVWEGKYGPMSTSQERYAASVLVGCIVSGHRDNTRLSPVALIKHRILQAVNHEVTHEGFLKRRHVDVIDWDARMAELELVAA